MTFDVDIFWERIKNLIKQNGYTQKSISVKMGYTPRTVETWINQKTIPNAFQTYILADILHTSVEYLVSGELNPTEKELRTIKEKIQKLAEEVL